MIEILEAKNIDLNVYVNYRNTLFLQYKNDSMISLNYLTTFEMSSGI